MASITEHVVNYAGDKSIYYLAAGPTTGPLVLLLHGWPATAITWKFQIDAFAALGFYVVAPDMPGYGKSTARRRVDDYSQEALVEGMMALLADTGRDAAVWIGHDWGAGVASSVATQHPEVVKALINICVPFRTVERGLEALLPLVNRELYPVDQFEYGQWDYMRNWEENFEKTIEWFDKDPAAVCKAFLQREKQPSNRIAPLAFVRKQGWLGGGPKPPNADAMGPTILPSKEFDSFAKDMQTTGFWPGSAYYLHHKRNAEYNGNAPSGGRLHQPVLFVHGTWDTVCDTKTSRLAEPMRDACSNLTEVTVDAGHFVQIQEPAQVNAALLRFIHEEVPSEWPGYWESGYTRKKSVL